MHLRLLAGSLLAYTYNDWIGHFPSRSIRHTFLGHALGGFGQGSGIQLGCRFLNPRKVFLGQRNVINFGCLFDGRKHNIVTGKDVSIGPEAAILTLGHDAHSPVFADRGGDVTLGDRVWIGYRAIILPGVTIGDGAVIGAGAVVSRDIDPHVIVAGNPAKKIGERDPNLTYRLDFQPWLL
jgi:acetyltransferase-like isoleucine patch superfamily enzyme